MRGLFLRYVCIAGVLLCKRVVLLSITHKLNSDHDSQFYVS
jgi:hypothetical protein